MASLAESWKQDRGIRAVLILFPLTVLAIAFLLVFQLYVQAADARHAFGWSFITSRSWDQVSDEFGALPFIYGTLVTSVLALLIAVPLGLGAAVFLSELAPPRISDAVTFVIELLAAVPSVIYGLLAVFILVPFVRDVAGPALQSMFGGLPILAGPVFGVSYLTAGLILAVMVLPLIISISRESLMAVPTDQREAALALGATKWETTWRVVIPYARMGIVGSVFLALARALGETMAVTMVIGNSTRINASLLAPGYSIAAVIANEFGEALDRLHVSSLVTLGLVLFALTFIINAFARLLILATTRKGSRAA